MFSTRYPSPSEVVAYAFRVHRLCGAAIVLLVREFVRSIGLRR